MEYIVKVPHGLLDMHEADTAIVFCMDFRYKDAAQEMVEKQLGLKGDAASSPGVVKFLVEGKEPFASALIQTLELAIKLHHIKEVILFPHATCGAYGIADAEEEYRVQGERVAEARKLLQRTFPQLRTRFFWSQGQADKDQVRFTEMD